MLGNSSSIMPIFAYFDKEYFEKENENLFSEAPKYLGHELMVPNLYDYHSLDWMGNAKVLKNTTQGIKLFSNICRHRQATILGGRGNSRNIVCNLHGWTYSDSGKLIGAPRFKEVPCKHLEATTLVSWKGLLFEPSRNILKDLNGLAWSEHLDFTNYNYYKTVCTEYDFNWKTFIEVYSEDYHVDIFHPGLGNFVDSNSLQWEFGDWHHVQMISIKSDLRQYGSDIYKKWHESVLSQYKDQLPKFGAIWMTYYPNIMVECYPHCIVISVAIPMGVEKTKVVTEFYYPDYILAFEPEFVEAEQNAYFETAKEDDEICYRMHEGRRALYVAGKNDMGVYQIPTEDGLRHFHQFLFNQLKKIKVA